MSSDESMDYSDASAQPANLGANQNQAGMGAANHISNVAPSPPISLAAANQQPATRATANQVQRKRSCETRMSVDEPPPKNPK